MGAVISRLQFASDNLSNISTQAQASESRIVDTDYSQATTELAKRNIIQQAAQAMLAQANQQPQMVLQLLK
jgi:flagellin